MEKKRLFIESDVLHDDEIRSSKRIVYLALTNSNIQLSKDVFDEIVGFAWHEPEIAWEAVKRCDEIYAYSSLVPLCGYGTYTGAPVVMDVMMQKAIDEGITGKSIYFLRNEDDIEWDGIDAKLLQIAFKDNDLYTTEFNESTCMYEFKKVNPSKLNHRV